MRAGRGREPMGWSTVIDGLNEVSRKIYFILFDHLKAQGLFDCLAGGELTVEELQTRLGASSEVSHRFAVVLQGLRAIGAVVVEGGRVRARRSDRSQEPVDDELISAVFGPSIGSYLDIYRRDRVLDPAFSLTFAGEQALLWEGLLNAPINTVGGDQAVQWIARPGARILELAFGPGRMMRQLIELVGETGEIYGLESSHHYVERAREEFRRSPTVVQLLEADVNEGLPDFADVMFEGAMFMGALQFVKDPPSLFRQLGRITGVGGRLVLGAFHTNKPCFANPALHLHMNLFSPPAFEYAVGDVKGWLWDAGFETNIAVEFGSYCSLYAQKMPDVLDGGARLETC